MWRLKSEIKAPADSLSGEDPHPSLQTASSLCPHLVEGERELSEVLSTRATNPIHDLVTSKVPKS